jgi:2-polyprenyl-3-methyl-5-hydroxy-6-metoxy-1,4-benzoquinol methylase
VADGAIANPYHQLLRCKACGHAFVSPSNLDEYKNEEIQLEYFGDDFAARAGFFVTLYERINARRTARALNLGPRSWVLEIGPGSGVVMGWLASLGHEVRGLDLSPAVARETEHRWRLPVTVEPLDVHIQSVGEEAYDAVIMRHVLEHFADPLDSLQNARAALKPGGKLYIAVPNMRSWHRHFRGWSGYEPYHVHYFCNTSLSLALRQAGFNVRETRSFESLIGWANTFMRSLKRQGTRGVGVPLQRNGGKRWILESLRPLVGVVLSPLRWFQARLGRGEELTAICVRTIA